MTTPMTHDQLARAARRLKPTHGPFTIHGTEVAFARRQPTADELRAAYLDAVKARARAEADRRADSLRRALPVPGERRGGAGVVARLRDARNTRKTRRAIDRARAHARMAIAAARSPEEVEAVLDGLDWPET